MKVKNLALEKLVPYENNPRNNEAAVDYVANSIKEFGFQVPIVIDKDNVIVAGHTRYKAAQKLELKEVPVVIAEDLTPEQVKAFRIADNKTAEKASWDFEKLAEEIADIELDFDFKDFGFGEFELDVLKNGNSFDESEYEFVDASQKNIDTKEKLCVVIDCKSEQEAENVFNKLSEEGYVCRIST